MKITAKVLGEYFGVDPETVRYHSRKVGGLTCLRGIITAIYKLERKRRESVEELLDSLEESGAEKVSMEIGDMIVSIQRKELQ